MYAGARSVVVSLWNVNDKATAELMARFYRGMLRENKTPAAALRTAQTEMSRQKEWQSPYYWAAFVLQGEWEWAGRIADLKWWFRTGNIALVSRRKTCE